MSDLVEHARRELVLCGQFDEDPAYAQSVIAAVAAFGSYEHSGPSEGEAVRQLTALLRRENLSALTDDPAEWIDRSEESGTPLWQNVRNPAAISYDHGRTYRLVSAEDDDVHTSAPHTARVGSS